MFTFLGPFYLFLWKGFSKEFYDIPFAPYLSPTYQQSLSYFFYKINYWEQVKRFQIV